MQTQEAFSAVALGGIDRDKEMVAEEGWPHGISLCLDCIEARQTWNKRVISGSGAGRVPTSMAQKKRLWTWRARPEGVERS